MHTEDEAKKLWCPYARVIGTLRQSAQPGESDYIVGQGSQNRGFTMGGPLTNCNCIGSKCMAFRWLRGHPIKGLSSTAESETGIMTKSNDPNSPRLGYCGLAGRP